MFRSYRVKYKYPDGIKYKGYFQADYKHGFGVCKWPRSSAKSEAKGQKYEGNWSNNYMHGNGILTLEDGRFY